MGKWLAGAACALALSGLSVPTDADAQGWLNRVKEAAKQKADSAIGNATGGMAGGARRGSCATNDTYQCARGAAVGEPIDGAIGGNARKLYYRMAVDQPGVLQFTLDPMPNQRGVGLHVTDAQYRELGSFGWGEGQPGSRLFQLAAPGTYYIILTHPGGEAEPFTLAVSNTPQSRSGSSAGHTTGCTLNNTFQCADRAAVGDRIDGAIGGNARKLYYRLAVDQPGTMQFTLDPMPNQRGVGLHVTDAQYREIGSFGWGKGQPGSHLFRLAAAGTYYIILTHPGGEAERFALSVRPQ